MATSVTSVTAPRIYEKGNSDMSADSFRSGRRIVIAGLSAAAATLGAVGSGSSRTDAQPLTPATSKPSAGAQDEWLDDKRHALHRILFDTTTSAGLGQALAFASVYFNVNKSSYAIDANDLSVLIIMHHYSTPFGFDDAIWHKYGKALADKRYEQDLTDPRSRRAPALNVYNCKAIDSLTNSGVTLDSLSEKGARFAVCNVAVHGIADLLSKNTHASADSIYAELTGHLIRNAALVSAGIVAINRAQELGFSYSVAI